MTPEHATPTSSAFQVTRPVWRTYDPRFVANAAAHARAGGHALVRDEEWYVLLPRKDDGTLPELAAWALLDLCIDNFRKVARGAAAGLVKAVVPRRKRGLVAEWCERDSTSPDSTLVLTLDCRACAMCCRNNRVILDEDDLARWRDAGRDDLLSKTYLRRSNGKLVLKLLPDGDCMHLVGNDCGIYAVRPFNCSVFPAASEGCLSARRDAGLDPGC